MQAKSVLRNKDEVFKFFREVCPAVFTLGSNPQLLRGMDDWIGDRNPSWVPKDNAWTPPEKPIDCSFNEFLDMQTIDVAFSEYGLGLLHDAHKKFGRVPLIIYQHAIPAIEGAMLGLAEAAQMPGLRLSSPPCAFAYELGSKIEMTKMAASVGVPSVPNVMKPVRSLEDLEKIGREDLKGARDLVVQAPYGFAGATTWFFDLDKMDEAKATWERVGEEMVKEKELKIMRRIARVRASAIEGTVLAKDIGGGVITSPCYSQLIGFPELTEEGKGGWCGGEACDEAVTEPVKKFAHNAARKIGQLLESKGYWGNFQVDVINDLDTGDIFLGEVNTRFSGATTLTSMVSTLTGRIPLAVYHILSALATYQKATTPAFEIGRELVEENAAVEYVSLRGVVGLSSVIVRQVFAHELDPADDMCYGLFQASEDLQSCKHMKHLDSQHLKPEDFGADVPRSFALTIRTVAKPFPVPHGCAMGRLWVRGLMQTPNNELTPLMKVVTRKFLHQLVFKGESQQSTP